VNSEQWTVGGSGRLFRACLIAEGAGEKSAHFKKPLWLKAVEKLISVPVQQDEFETRTMRDKNAGV
jgi:hypothetical protein